MKAIYAHINTIFISVCVIWVLVVANLIHMANDKMQFQATMSFVQSTIHKAQQLSDKIVTTTAIRNLLKGNQQLTGAYLLDNRGKIMTYVSQTGSAKNTDPFEPLPHRKLKTFVNNLQSQSFIYSSNGGQVNLLLPIKEKFNKRGVIYIQAYIKPAIDKYFHIFEIMVLTLLFFLIFITRLQRHHHSSIFNIVDKLRKLREGEQVDMSDGLLTKFGDFNPIASELNLTLNALKQKTAYAEKQQADQIHRLTNYDPLTSLPNHKLFKDHLSKTIARAERYGEKFGLVTLDVDHFTSINNQLGESSADRLLQMIAQKINQEVRKSDLISNSSEEATFARIRSDEFCICLHNIKSQKHIDQFINRIIRCTKKSLMIDDTPIYVSFSFGTSRYPEDGNCVETLTKNSEIALFEAKTLGGGKTTHYHPSLSEHHSGKLFIENGLREALQEGQFFAVFQPKFDLNSNHICGAEALIRWDHPTEGIIEPSKFIPIAEESNLIVQIGEWMLFEACKECRSWHDKGYKDMKISVNVSTRQFSEANLIDTIKRALRESQLPPQALEIELTEGTLINADRRTLDTLNEMRILGLGISIDDFGTGYSSLKYISQFPLDIIKIDRSFITEMMKKEKDSEITLAIIHLAQILHLKVTAEGVEDIEQLDALKNMGCDYIQGFYIAKPQRRDNFMDLLQQRGDK